MTEIETLTRKIKLKNQALQLIDREIQELKIQRALLIIKKYFESKMSDRFNDVLSKKLECIQFLIEN